MGQITVLLCRKGIFIAPLLNKIQTDPLIFCLFFLRFAIFVCLGVFVPLENFLLTKTSSSLVKAYARHSWTLSSEGSLTCHTCCYTEHPFIMVIFEDPLAERLAVALSLPFLRLRSVAAGIRTPNALTHCTNAALALLCKCNQSHQEE